MGILFVACEIFSFPCTQGESFKAVLGLRPIIMGKQEYPVAVSKDVKVDSNNKQR